MGELAYKDEQVLLHWEDGSCDTIVFSRELIEKGYYDFDVIEEIFLNGVPQESFELQIAKKCELKIQCMQSCTTLHRLMQQIASVDAILCID